jgi:ATP-dependent protease HslVU (ClpYQ) ATPase subunit
MCCCSCGLCACLSHSLQRLLGCEGVKLQFTPEAIQEIAAMAEQINKEVRGGVKQR